MYVNKRAEAAFTAQKRGWAGRAGVNQKDNALIEELKADEYEERRGMIALVEKKEIKKRIGRSPGNADCWKMFQYACELDIKDRTNIYKDDNRTPQYALMSDDSLLGNQPLPAFAI